MIFQVIHIKGMKSKFKIGISVMSAAAIIAAAVPAVIKNDIKVSAANLLTAEFETTNDSFTARGGNTVAWTSDKSYSSNCSLFVSGRTDTWNGAAREASSFMKAGNTYKISAVVYQESGEDTEMKFSLQYNNGTETAYDAIDLKTAPSGEWTVLSNDAYTVPEGAKDLVIYVETTESLTDFYVDLVKVNGAPSVVKQGDANGDLKVNSDDAAALRDYIVCRSDEIEEAADMNDDGVINVFDVILLENYLLNPPTPPTPTVSGDWDNYQENVTPQMLQVYKDSLYRVGNTERIREKIAKAQSGEQVNIAYLGGSITEGGSSSNPSKSFANLSYEYFSETFGGNVNYINAGMAGTSSVVGNLRVDKDVFSKNADIIFIEYAVNDQDGDRFKKSYESLVKKCLSQENKPAVVLITLCSQSGGSCQDWMAKVAENYDLPLISGRDAVMNAIKAGTLSWGDYGSGDTLHPGDGGHKLISEWIGYYYRQALRSENAPAEEFTINQNAVFGSEYSTAKLLTVDQMNNLSKGSWTSGTNNPGYSANGFTYSKNGNEPLKFTVEGKGIMLLFQSNDNASMGTVNVTVNGKTNPVSSNLKWTWGGLDADAAYYQNESGLLDVSINMQNPSTNFVLYGIAVIS